MMKVKNIVNLIWTVGLMMTATGCEDFLTVSSESRSR
jgi:hypothetical protein